VSGPTNGNLTLNSNGGFSYTPTSNFSGVASFTYLAKDSVSNSTPATVTIDVLPAGNLFYDNFTRATNADPLAPWVVGLGKWSIGGGVLQGTASGENDYSEAYIGGNWTDYSVQGRVRLPAGSWAGGLSGRLNPLTGAKYTLNIYPENSPLGPAPCVRLIKFHSWRKWSSTWTPMALVSLPSVGTNWNMLKLTFKGNQIVVYFNGTQVVNMTDDDVDGLPAYLSGGIGAHMYMDSAFVANFDDITVLPLISDDSYNAVENQTLVVPASGVLSNDTQGLVTNLTAAVVTGPTHGTLNLSTNGGFSYLPATNFLGMDSFTYQANAGQTNLGTATVVITVSSTNHAPVLPAQPNQVVSALATLVVTNTASDVDFPAQTLTYQLISPPSGASIDANGIITWAPSGAQIGPYTITTVVTDSGTPPLSATNSFAVTVNGTAIVAVDSTTLIAEACLPTNNAVDPGETVTVVFALKNTGLGNTTNLVATLLATNGVISPTGPQTYGVLVAGGAAVSQPFTFAANGVCGSNISAILQLQDGSLNLGTASVLLPLGASTTVFTQNFDAVTAPALPSGWTTSASGYQSNWVTQTSVRDTPPNAVYSNDGTNVGINALVSPPIALPLGQARLSFRHSYAFEADTTQPTNGWDGGVLEIQISTNAFTDITNNGGSWVANGYNRKIDTLYESPLSNRWAWSGTSGGFVTTTVSLPPASAGQTIQLRWRAGTDNGNGDGGWWVDSVSITAPTCCSSSPPVLPEQTNQTIAELANLTVTNTATSLGTPANPLTYLLVNPPAGAAINTNGVITWAPSQTQSPGTNTITTAAINSGVPSLSATNTFTVVVQEVNVPPVLPVIASQTINELTLLTATNTASEADIHATLGYELVNPPVGAAIDASGIITWTPSQIQSPGTNTITTVVTNTDPHDLINPHLSATNSFTVVVREVNVAPVLPVIAKQTINELTLLTVTNTASEADIHATLGYELVNPPVGAAIDVSGIITWTPSQTQSPGTNTITSVVTNTDPYDLINSHLSATNSFTVVVREVNVAPILQVIADQTLNELTLLTVTNTASEADIHATLGYELVNPPVGAAIDASGIITWTPSQTQSSSTNTIITVVTNTDPYDLINPHLSATNSFTVVVREVNVAPILQVIADQTVNELALLTVTNTASEADIHATLGYMLVNPPAGAAIDASGIITWTPSQTQSPSTNTITTLVTNTDPYDLINPHLSATNSFTVFVQAPPQLLIESITLSADTATLKWGVIVGQNYRLQYRDSILGTNWNDLAPDVTATGIEATVTAPITGSTQRFYRVFLVPK
jgi:transposase-like protein